MKKPAAIILTLVCTLYLLNPGAGIFELIPDHLPLIGNLDEAAVTALLLACLRSLGLDLTNLFGPRKSP